MAGILEFSTGRAPVVADLGAYSVPDVAGTYSESGLQAIADQVGVVSDKLRDLINALQSINLITAS